MTGRPWTDGAGIYPFYDGSFKDEEAYLQSNLNDPLRTLGRQLGFTEEKNLLRPHRFRDSFAVNMLNAGVMIQDVQLMLGHRHLSTTETYYKPFVKSTAEAIEKRVTAALHSAHYAEALRAVTDKTRERALIQ